MLNLLTGCIGIVYLLSGNPDTGALIIVFAAAFFDVLDGMAARLLDQKSDIGKDLDSLADLVSFGLYPSILLFKLMVEQGNGNQLIYGLPAMLITLSSALRLAKFNHDPRQSTYFIGVPTPANGIFITCATLHFSQMTDMQQPTGNLDNYWVLLALVIISTIWMHLPIRLFSLKFSFADGLKTLIPHIVWLVVVSSFWALSGFELTPAIIAVAIGTYVSVSMSFQRIIGR